ncbi:MAG: HAMP domain-containing sensor histidine kinase, partial [Chloroflexota bacterium]
ARWLVAVRWVTLTVAAALVLLANSWLGTSLPVLPLVLTLVGIAAYNALFWHLVHQLTRRDASRRRYAWLMHGQVVCDLLALTSLLHFSGGLENPFAPYYMLIVLIGSLLMARRDSYWYAAIASLLWVGLLLAEALGWLPHYNLVGFRLAVRYKEASHIVAESVVLVSGNVACAYLAATIIERLRAGEQQLLEASASCELRAGELADLNQRLLEASASCELRAGELAELNQRLKEVDQTRTAFIRLVTHELRAPVAAIQSYLRLILDGYVPESRLQEIITKAEQRANDQLDLIGDLLELARAQEPGRREPPKPCDPLAVLRDVLDMMQARIEAKSLTCETRLPETLPCVVASAEHMRQIWINLISNAIKYTREGGHVGVTVERDGTLLRVAVTDTGIGIAPDEQKRVFETFYRTEAAKAMSARGTGLGLAIVRGIVEGYGGRIWLTSEVGHGSTFTFELPLAKVAG